MKKIYLFILLFGWTCAVGQVCFSPSQSPNGVLYLHSITSGDFNEDGNIDIIAPYGSYSVSLSLGNGQGALGLPIIQTVATAGIMGGVNAISSADYNNDGHLDLAAAISDSSVTVFLGNGNGTFGPMMTYKVGQWIGISMVSADFNNDGNMDIAVLNNNLSNKVSVILGAGNGTFGLASSYAIAPDSYQLISADFNSDGVPDLAVAGVNANVSGKVSVLIGNGSGSFGGYSVFITDTGSIDLVSGDFNGDSKMDIVTYNYSTQNNISVLLGDGSGGFAPHLDFNTGIGINGFGWGGICSGDFDGDNKLDVAIVGTGDSTAFILKGSGSGAFGNPVNIQAACIPAYVISRDMNNDGKPDLVFPIRDSSLTASPFNAVVLNCTPTPTCVASVTDSLFNISPLNWGIVPHYSSQVISAVWNWGDGTSTSGLYPTHTYTATGWYNICVTVYTSCGDSAGACRNDTLYKMAGNNSMIGVSVVTSANGIKQNTFVTNDISVYPNPTGDQFTIETNNSDKLAVELFDLNGRVVFSKSLSGKTKIDVANLDEGIYTLAIITKDKVVNKKMVIVR